MSGAMGDSYFSIQKELSASPSSFPNVSQTTAEFRPHSHTIHLHTIRGDILKATPRDGNLQHIAEPFSILTREVSHWVDLLSTIWGQEYLIAIYDAYEAMESNAEEKLWQIIRLYDNDRRIMLPHYCKVVAPETSTHNPDRPWQVTGSCGVEFGPDGRLDPSWPIFFVIFGDNATGERVARQPLSVGSLLEIIATAAELQSELSTLNRIPDPDERKVALAIWKSRRIAQLYDPDHLDYTVAAHWLSVRIGTGELIHTYLAGALLAGVCLNLTESHFNVLRMPEQFAAHFDQERIVAFRSRKDRGFAFACIAYSSPKSSFAEEGVRDWLSRALEAAGLPSSIIIDRDAFRTMKGLSSTIRQRWAGDKTRDYLFDVGRAMHLARITLRRPLVLSDLLTSNLPVPPVFDANGDTWHFGERNLDNSLFDPIRTFDWEWRLREFTNNFLLACRGVRA